MTFPVSLKNIGQVSLEFMFAMMAVVLLTIGMIKVFVWTGVEMLNGQRMHEQTLLAGEDPMTQTRPYFTAPTKIGAYVNSSIFGDENP